MGDPLGRGVGAVRGAESVVDVEVGERRQRVARGPVGSRSRPGSKRVFSSSRTSPALEPRRAASTSAPTTAGRQRRPRFRAARRAVRRPAPSRAPGRGPRAGRGASRGRLAAPRSRSSSIVGSAARIRVSSADPAVLQRHVQVGADEDRPALDVRVANRGLLESTALAQARPAPDAAQRTLPASSTSRFE